MDTLKQKLINFFKTNNVDLNKFKIKYYKESPYQKSRFKKEFVEEECWIILPNRTKFNYCITTTNFENPDFMDMVISELKQIFNI